MEQEIDFYSIALAKFLQAAPELAGSIVSFKDISEDLSQESDMKVGVFILKVGTEAFYVPVISKMDNVYPVDSVFMTSTSKFFPITKKTVDIILTSSKMSPGKGTKIPSTVTANPDVTSMITPPRTGKFVYASSSRLGDFLQGMPDYLKGFVMEKVAEERSAYEGLHKLFAIKDILDSLKPAPGGLAAVVSSAPISIVTGATPNLTDEEISSILNGGYAIQGTPLNTRVAVSSMSYDDGKFTTIQELDGDTDYELVFASGSTREAFIPKIQNIHQGRTNRLNSVALFTNGDYAIDTSFVASGTKLDRTLVLDTLFGQRPPVLPRDVEIGDTFAILNSDSHLLGIFVANKVMMSNLGIEIMVSCRAGFSMGTSYTINAYRNYAGTATLEGANIYIPYASLVIKLGDDVTYNLERSVNSAAKKREISEAGILGDQLNLAFDGVEYSVNGKPIGSEANLMQKLAVEEGIDPKLATSFIKQANERKSLKIYLSKKASTDFKPADIPQYGNIPTPPPKVGLNGSFMPNVSKSLQIGDAQTTEATIISELLQTPDMIELIEEYLPDIEECIDKLGRILFLSRVHINQLADSNDADGVFAFLSSLKSVYKMLGENMLKLKEMIAIKPEPK